MSENLTNADLVTQFCELKKELGIRGFNDQSVTSSEGIRFPHHTRVQRNQAPKPKLIQFTEEEVLGIVNTLENVTDGIQLYVTSSFLKARLEESR